MFSDGGILGGGVKLLLGFHTHFSWMKSFISSDDDTKVLCVSQMVYLGLTSATFKQR